MAQSKIKITFGQDLIVGSTISFLIDDVPYTWTYVPTRLGAFEVTTGIPNILTKGKVSAENFKNAFDLDFPTGFETEMFISRNSTSITIKSDSVPVNFSGGLSTYTTGTSSAFITFEITRGGDIELLGLENNNYLLNNEIWLDIYNNAPIESFNLKVTNTSNNQTLPNFTLYAINGKASVNLQPIFKSLFDSSEIRNYNRFKIQVDEVIIYKTIIRGGERTELTNRTITLLSTLRNSINLPIWQGYPTDEYFLDSDSTIQKRTPANLDYRKEKNCNSLYFKFLNQLGGYSNWLFENSEETETNTNLGAYSRERIISDMGNEVKNSLSVYSKVPKEYYGLIKDLFVSPEIYIWKDLRWVRVFSGRNTSQEDPSKKAYAVKAKFDFENRFNPSALWSN